MTAYPKSIEALPEEEATKLLAERAERDRHGIPPAAYESEADFKLLREELSQELAGYRLGFGCQIAHEAATSRQHINRNRRALRAIASLDLASTTSHGQPILKLSTALPGGRFPETITALEESKAVDKSKLSPHEVSQLPHLTVPELEAALDRRTDIETRRYEEDRALLDRMRYADQAFFAMGIRELICSTLPRQIRSTIQFL